MTLSLGKGLGRAAYVTAGVTLFAVKIALDVAVARAFSRPYSLLYYISPSDAPLFRPAESPAYWLAMWAVALPFIAVGFVLTIRRLRDAGLSPWLALFFFAPFANILFFGFCALVPGADAAAGPGDHRAGTPARMTYARAAAAAGAVGAGVGLAAFALAVLLLGSYGGALFIGAPPIGGFVSGLLFARWHRPNLAGAILSATLSIPIGGAVVIGFALEGLICLAMALPLVVTGSIMGAAIGCLLERGKPGAGAAPATTALLLLPLIFITENVSPLPASESLPIESSIVIDAPAGTVWDSLIAFPPLPPPTEWIFRAGFAAPMGAVIDGRGRGGVRRCLFTTGSFVEPIDTWDPPRELGFAVASSPDPMREWTLWHGPRPPHLDGYLESTRGQFLLEVLPEGRTRLVGRTWYRTNMVPESYWRLWADPVIHAIHMRVLRHVAVLSERPMVAPGPGALRDSVVPSGLNRGREGDGLAAAQDRHRGGIARAQLGQLLSRQAEAARSTQGDPLDGQDDVPARDQFLLADGDPHRAALEAEALGRGAGRDPLHEHADAGWRDVEHLGQGAGEDVAIDAAPE